MNSLGKNVKILIVDDHILSRQGMATMLCDLAEFNPVLTEAENGAEAINLLSQENYDLVLLDLQMPKMDGCTALTTLRENGNDTPIIMFSFHGDELLMQRLINAGANGFLSKGVSCEELMTGITEVLSGKSYFLGTDVENASQLGLDNSLTKREHQILKLIAEESTNVEIADKLCISVRTVEGHKKNLTDKLMVKGSVGLTKYALKYGIIKNG